MRPCLAAHQDRYSRLADVSEKLFDLLVPVGNKSLLVLEGVYQRPAIQSIGFGLKRLLDRFAKIFVADRFL